MPKLSLSDNEYFSRRKSIFDRTAGKHVDAFVLFSPNNVSYFSRFGFVPTERPIGYILTPTQSILFLPRLEVEHGEQVGLIDGVVGYPEYPGDRAPLETLKDKLIDLGLQSATLGVDVDGYMRLYGYRGPRLSELLPDATIVDVVDEIEYMQMVNSTEELELIHEACKWGDVAHRYLQNFSKVGVSEIEIAQKASQAASNDMIAALGPIIDRAPSLGHPPSPDSAARSALLRPIPTHLPTMRSCRQAMFLSLARPPQSLATAANWSARWSWASRRPSRQSTSTTCLMRRRLP